jgi:hypothetical protein
MSVLKQKHLDVKKTSYKYVMKTMKTYIPIILVGTLLFVWSIRENFQDTATIQGPPYGNTATSAQNIINMMTPELLTSVKRRMGVTSTNLTNAEKIRLVHGDGTNNSPISQVMSNFYWQVYKTSTVTISTAQVNTFLTNQNDSWVNANTADLREFLKRYFLQGQEGAQQSGYGDLMNSVLGVGLAAQATTKKDTKTETKTETKKEDTKTDVTQRLITIAAIALAGFSIFAAIIVFLLPSRV